MALEAGGFLVGTATIEIELEAVRQDPAAAVDSK